MLDYYLMPHIDKETIRWAVVGTGDIARKRVLPAICDDPRSRLRAIVTRDPAKLRDSFGAERVVASLEDALADPQVDVVYIATPVSLHYPQTMAALAAGKHVLCEKPTALNPGQVEAMIAAAAASGKTFGVSFYRRLYPAVARVRELLKQGAIGQPVFAWVSCHGWFNEVEVAHRAWLFDPAFSGGGPLMDVGSHRIDLLNYIFGEPRLAGAAISRQTQRSPAFKVEDNATLTIEYNRDVRAVVDVRWNSRIARDEFRVIGTDGEIEVSPLNVGLIRYPGGTESLPPPENFHVPLIAHFSRVLLEGAEPVSTGKTALATDRLMAEAYASSTMK